MEAAGFRGKDTASCGQSLHQLQMDPVLRLLLSTLVNKDDRAQSKLGR